jgi:uncharacterized protein YgbK (DUF1537 family)
VAQSAAIAVIADDLTGAADTGVQFCPAVGAVYLSLSPDGRIDKLQSGCSGLCLSTNSRHADAATAGALVRAAWQKVRACEPVHIYKKIDSALRGNPGAEIEALLHASSAAVSFIAPAFPGMGRTTEHDLHLVKGVAVAQTEVGRDPRCPVSESRLSKRIGSQCSLPIGHVDISSMEKGLSAVAAKVRALLGEGKKHIVFDVTTDEHLDDIVRLTRSFFTNEKILMAGSAGLAHSLASDMISSDGAAAPPVRPSIADWLFVCGSLSEVTQGQIADLEDHTSWPWLQLDPSLLAAGESIINQPLVNSGRGAGLPGIGLILSITLPESAAESAKDPERVISGLAKTALALLKEHLPQGLFLSGGDTAEAVLKESGAEGILLYEQILPGLMCGRITGGLLDRLPVVTKGGAFGHRDTLTTLITILQ